MPGSLESLVQGFDSFYSIWQACVAQISPFFMAYIVGIYFAAYAQKTSPPSIIKRTVFPGFVYMLGFSVPYAMQTAVGLPVGRFLAYNSGSLSFIAGIVILLISLFIALHGRLNVITRLDVPVHTALISLLLGIAFALVYSPCITPTLSKIMGVASRAETAYDGLFLAFYYGLGISVAFVVTATALVFVFSRIAAFRRHLAGVKDVSAIILAILAVLNISGYMTHYKAFILGFLVS